MSVPNFSIALFFLLQDKNLVYDILSCTDKRSLKIQAIYFKIGALYFKIYGLYF